MSEKISLEEQLKVGQVLAPAVYDCLVATMARHSGFQTYVVSAESVAKMTRGLEDVSLLTGDDMIHVTNTIADFLEYPVLVDFANGFSDNPALVAKYVEELVEETEVQAIILDDASADGKGVVAEELYLAKLAAALKVVADSEVKIIAASNAELSAATSLLKKAKNLGAFAVLARKVKTTEDAEVLAKAVDGYKVLDDFSSQNGVDLAAIEQLGFVLVTVHYLEKSSLYGLMKYGLRTVHDRHTVWADFDDFEGNLPSMNYRDLYDNHWHALTNELAKTVREMPKNDFES